MSFVFKGFSKNWEMPFYVSRGIKYKLTLTYIGYNTTGLATDILPQMPISAKETQDGKVVATFPDMTRSVFLGIHELAENFYSTIVQFESEDEYGEAQV